MAIVAGDRVVDPNVLTKCWLSDYTMSAEIIIVILGGKHLFGWGKCILRKYEFLSQ